MERKKRGREEEGEGGWGKGGRKERREERRRETKIEGGKKEDGRREGKWEEKMWKGRKAGGSGGRKCGYRHRFCINQRLPLGDGAEIPTRAAPMPSPRFCHVALFQTPCDAVGSTSLSGLRRVGSGPRKPFPTRYGCPLQMFANISTAGACITQFLNHEQTLPN